MASEMERLAAALKKREENVANKKEQVEKKKAALVKKYDRLCRMMDEVGFGYPDEVMDFIEQVEESKWVETLSQEEAAELNKINQNRNDKLTVVVYNPLVVEYAKAVNEKRDIVPTSYTTFGFGFPEKSKTGRFISLLYDVLFGKNDVKYAIENMERAERERLRYVKDLDGAIERRSKTPEYRWRTEPPEVLVSLQLELEDDFFKRFMEILEENKGKEKFNDSFVESIVNGGEDYCRELAKEESVGVILRFWEDVERYLPIITDWKQLQLVAGNKGAATINGIVVGFDRQGNERKVEVYSRWVAENSSWVSPHIRTSVNWL